MRTLDIAPDLQLPLDAVTQKFAWIGRTGSGKTYGLKRFVEQMLYAGVQVIVLDTVGVWSGLRLGSKGFDVPVLGGFYGDIPLEHTSGALVAEVVVSHGSGLVLDTSQMTDGQRARFCEAFGRRLFELKKATPAAMHIVLDEGQDVVPQNPNEGEKMMLHEWVRIAKQGRAFGMGLSIAGQRPQEINKKALNQAECVFAFQLTGSHERKALEYWLADKGMETKLSDALLTLEIGRPFVWSPQWLKISKVIERIHPIDSADTSKTPQFGDAPRIARQMKPIDLGALRESMAAVVEQTKENDPKALRARIQELEQLVAAGAGPAAAPVVVFDKKKAEKLRDSHDAHVSRAQQLLQWEHAELQEIHDRIEKLWRNSKLLEQHLETNTLADDLGAFLDDLRTTNAPPVDTKHAERKARWKGKTVLSTKQAADAGALSRPVEQKNGDHLPTGELATLSAIATKKGGALRAYLVLVTGLRKASIDVRAEARNGRTGEAWFRVAAVRDSGGVQSAAAAARAAYGQETHRSLLRDASGRREHRVWRGGLCPPHCVVSCSAGCQEQTVRGERRDVRAEARDARPTPATRGEEGRPAPGVWSMNWLHSLTEKILAERGFPGEQRRALVLWANELSIICDQRVPKAPAPELLSLDPERPLLRHWCHPRSSSAARHE